jgi:hypothetical protein
LQPHAAQLQRPGSQEQDPPHWQFAALRLVLPFFVWFLRFVFIVIDFFLLRRVPGVIARLNRPFTRANGRPRNPLQSFLKNVFGQMLIAKPEEIF